MKLPLQEAEHDVLLVELAKWDGHVSGGLLGVEAIRACARYGEQYAKDARSWLADVALLPIDDALLDEAASLRPNVLRSLDALHLATALSVRDEVGVFVTYDGRLATAAEEHGLTVTTPAQCPEITR
jgi:uncharacterized protein